MKSIILIHIWDVEKVMEVRLRIQIYLDQQKQKYLKYVVLIVVQLLLL